MEFSGLVNSSKEELNKTSKTWQFYECKICSLRDRTIRNDKFLLSINKATGIQYLEFVKNAIITLVIFLFL